MGHFGRAPIRLAWFGLVLPALVLNYFGQGALLLRDPAALEHPFYHLAPDWLLWPLIGLATLATIIASQAVISGVFSLTGQAIQLGHLSRMTVRHTSAATVGQIYIPRVNCLPDGRRCCWSSASAHRATSPRLMASRSPGRWRSTPSCRPGRHLALGLGPAAATVVFGGFFLLDFAYLAANALKIPAGGWLPLAIAAGFAATVVTWRRGRRVVRDRLHATASRSGASSTSSTRS